MDDAEQIQEVVFELDETHLKTFSEAVTFFRRRLQCFEWKTKIKLDDANLGMSFQIDPVARTAELGLAKKQASELSDDDLRGFAYKAVLEMLFSEVFVLVSREGTPPWTLVGKLKSLLGKLEQSYPDSKFAAILSEGKDAGNLSTD